jgi:P-type Cu+ transporter
MNTRRVAVPLSGLGCGGGGSLVIERALERVEGVARAYVNSATEMAYVEYDADRVAPLRLVATVEALGFRAGEPLLR